MPNPPVVESLFSSDFFRGLSQKWDQVEGLPQCALLRLSLMREIVRTVHAEKSKHLALGAKTNAEALKFIESNSRELQNHVLTDLPLKTILTSPNSETVTRKDLPLEFIEALGKDKFQRYDRAWEKDLAAEALEIGWSFWGLDAWVQITAAEEFHHRLTGELFPRGTVLFVEAAPRPESEMATASFDAGPVWKGRWFTILDSNANEKTFNIEHLAGLSSRPQKPHWTLLFPHASA